jgi:hypothetical protein
MDNNFIPNFPLFKNRTNQLIELVNREISNLPTQISSMNNMDSDLFNTIYNNLDRYYREVKRKIKNIHDFLQNRSQNRRKRLSSINNTLEKLYDLEQLLIDKLNRMDSIIRNKRGPVYGNENFGKSQNFGKKIPAKYYSGRKSPPVSATIYQVGFKKQGLDGNYWIIIQTSNGVKRWKKILS